MARLRVAALAASVLALTACGFVAPPVRVQGTPEMLDQLSGEWWGEYVGDRLHGRNGSIVFKLEAGEYQAHGDVLMTPRGAERPYGRRIPGRDTARPAGASNVLTIRFVSAIEGTITGALDPYSLANRAQNGHPKSEYSMSVTGAVGRPIVAASSSATGSAGGARRDRGGGGGVTTPVPAAIVVGARKHRFPVGMAQTSVPQSPRRPDPPRG